MLGACTGLIRGLKMNRRSIIAGFAALALLVPIFLVGCGGGTTDPTNPDAKIEKIATSIKLGTSTTVSIGLLVIQDQEEAKVVATLAQKVLDENVLPILNGDEAGLVDGLKSLLELKAFDDPKLAKIKLLLEAGLPLLEANLPPNLVDQGIGKIPPDVKVYLTAFFTGAKEGLDNYLGNRAPKGLRGFSSYQDLRAKLNAK